MKKLIATTLFLFALLAFSSCEDKGSKSYPEIDESFNNVPIEVIKEVQK